VKIINKWNDWIDEHHQIAMWIFYAAMMLSMLGLAYTNRIYFFLWIGIIIYSLVKLFKMVMGLAPVFY